MHFAIDNTGFEVISNNNDVFLTVELEDSNDLRIVSIPHTEFKYSKSSHHGTNSVHFFTIIFIER